MYAAEKVYQQLKFEALPRFLISERFKTLENKHQKLWPTREMVSAIEEVEILSVLMEPKGMEKMQVTMTTQIFEPGPQPQSQSQSQSQPRPRPQPRP